MDVWDGGMAAIPGTEDGMMSEAIMTAEIIDMNGNPIADRRKAAKAAKAANPTWEIEGPIDPECGIWDIRMTESEAEDIEAEAEEEGCTEIPTDQGSIIITIE
jgi:hypothetical protein